MTKAQARRLVKMQAASYIAMALESSKTWVYVGPDGTARSEADVKRIEVEVYDFMRTYGQRENEEIP